MASNAASSNSLHFSMCVRNCGPGLLGGVGIDLKCKKWDIATSTKQTRYPSRTHIRASQKFPHHRNFLDKVSQSNSLSLHSRSPCITEIS